jgi:hypothetical protein
LFYNKRYTAPGFINFFDSQNSHLVALGIYLQSAIQRGRLMKQQCWCAVARQLLETPSAVAGMQGQFQTSRFEHFSSAAALTPV